MLSRCVSRGTCATKLTDEAWEGEVYQLGVARLAEYIQDDLRSLPGSSLGLTTTHIVSPATRFHRIRSNLFGTRLHLPDLVHCDCIQSRRNRQKFLQVALLESFFLFGRSLYNVRDSVHR